MKKGHYHSDWCFPATFLIYILKTKISLCQNHNSKTLQNGLNLIKTVLRLITLNVSILENYGDKSLFYFQITRYSMLTHIIMRLESFSTGIISKSKIR